MVSTQVVDFEPEDEVVDERVGSVTLLSAPHTGATHAIDHGELVIGRSPEVSLYVNDAGLSRRHARLYRVGSSYFVEDLGSTNGTLVNGERVTSPVQLVDGVRVLVGKQTILRFALQDRLELDAARRMYDQSIRDGLTGLSNRRHLEERLTAEYGYAKRHGSPLCVLIIDADHFKRVNDTFGHQAGDEVLRALGGLLQGAARREDVAARYGGEEFVLVARAVDLAQAMGLAERIRAATEACIIDFDNQRIPVTVSIGVAASNLGSHGSATELLAAADAALYRAKAEGRNRVCAHPGD